MKIDETGSHHTTGSVDHPMSRRAVSSKDDPPSVDTNRRRIRGGTGAVYHHPIVYPKVNGWNGEYRSDSRLDALDRSFASVCLGIKDVTQSVP